MHLTPRPGARPGEAAAQALGAGDSGRRDRQAGRRGSLFRPWQMPERAPPPGVTRSPSPGPQCLESCHALGDTGSSVVNDVLHVQVDGYSHSCRGLIFFFLDTY